MGFGVALVAVGAVKLTVAEQELVRRGAPWTDGFTPGAVKLVACTELVGGLAVLLPAALGLPSPLPAAIGTAGLGVVALGAAPVHARRRETGMIALNVGLLAAVTVALWSRS
jgi:protein-S-isoprenylcysteine O-methyltransferase Ste14